ncbi:MAG: lipoyl(octanoyl) transferase LipB [Saprospiraceae bacterium]|nr:lipoyl(octanoyl) transferase LipB [Saprospiraceae bacterium]
MADVSRPRAGLELPKVEVHSLGQVSYAQALEVQTELRDALIAAKRSQDSEQVSETIHHLVFCQHQHVYTLGKSGKEANLLLDQKGLEEAEIEFYKAGRGGDITYHGPGQLVCYPIFDLDHFFTDVHRYVRTLEEAVIATCSDYGIETERLDGFTGVWLSDAEQMEKKRKICAIGVHLSRWVTMHGLALNVNTDLSFFDHVIPCGIADPKKTVTSLKQELDRALPLVEVEARLLHHLARLFNFEPWKTT